MTEAIVTVLISLCIFLFASAAIYRFCRNFILPGETLMLAFGVISGIIPSDIYSFERIYDFFFCNRIFQLNNACFHSPFDL